VEAIGRIELLTDRLPAARARSCCRQRQGTTGLGTFWIEDATSGWREARDQRRDRYVTSDATEVWPRRDSEGRLKRAWRHVRTDQPRLRSRKRASERKRLMCGER
jgi:hypothetical protein